MSLPAGGTDKQGRPFLLRELRPGDRGRLERMYADFEPKRVAQGLPPADPAPALRRAVQPSNRRAVRSYEKVGFRTRFTTGWAPELEMETILPPLDDS